MSWVEFGGRILTDLPTTDFTIRDRVSARLSAEEGPASSGADVDAGELSPVEKRSLMLAYRRDLLRLRQAGQSPMVDMGKGVFLPKLTVFEMACSKGDQLEQAGLGERAKRIREVIKSKFPGQG